MGERREHFRRYREAIRNILLRDWDPIGVADEPDAQDEYDNYIPQIQGMLILNEPEPRLVDYLWHVETESMSLIGDRKRTESVAIRLIALRAEIEATA
jgi:hypothetical protein